MEIIGINLARAESRKVIATLLRMPDGSWIGRVADMIIFSSGGIELDNQPSQPRLGPQHGLGRRGPTDVTHANDEHAAGLSGIGHGLDLAAEALVIVQVEHIEPGDDVFTLGTRWGSGLVFGQFSPPSRRAGGSLFVKGAEGRDFLA